MPFVLNSKFVAHHMCTVFYGWCFLWHQFKFRKKEYISFLPDRNENPELPESVKPLTTNVLHHTETNKLICNANKMTGFYMMENIGH